MYHGGIDEALARLRQMPDAVLLDVRTPEEFARGHIPGSINLPLERIAAADLDPSAMIFTYCHSGARSARAAAALTEMDYHAENIGGIQDYSGELEESGTA